MEVDNDLVEIIKSELQHNGGISLLTLRNIDQNHLVETINQISQDLSIGEGNNLEYKLSDDNLDELWDKLKTNNQVILETSNKRNIVAMNNNSAINNNKKKQKNQYNSPAPKSAQLYFKRQNDLKRIIAKTNNFWKETHVEKVYKQTNDNKEETILKLNVEQIMKVTGLKESEAKTLYFDSGSNPNTAIKTYRLLEENRRQRNNNNNNDNNNNNNNNNTGRGIDPLADLDI